jgi:hypothetical protein
LCDPRQEFLSSKEIAAPMAAPMTMPSTILLRFTIRITPFQLGFPF